MRHTYVCTVCGERPRRSAIRFSESPSNTPRTIPHSRGERPRHVESERHSAGTNTACPDARRTGAEAGGGALITRLFYGWAPAAPDRPHMEEFTYRLGRAKPCVLARLVDIPLVFLGVADPDLGRVVRVNRLP